MSIEAAKEKVAQLEDELRRARQQLANYSNDAFHDAVAILFANHPVLHGFNWRQYTPYFNDGDVCTFSAHTDYPTLYVAEGVEWPEEHMYVDNPNYRPDPTRGYWEDRAARQTCLVNPAYTPAHQSAERAVQEVLGLLSEETCEAIWGDHVEVTVTRDGIAAEPYDHE